MVANDVPEQDCAFGAHKAPRGRYPFSIGRNASGAERSFDDVSR